MKDPLKMLRQVQQMQDRMQKMQKELESETVEATAGGGAVTVVATGTQKLVSVRIDPEAAGGKVERDGIREDAVRRHRPGTSARPRLTLHASTT